MSLDQLRAFLTELKKKKELLNAIRVAATANEIAEIASGFGYQFSGNELKAASKAVSYTHLTLPTILLV